MSDWLTHMSSSFKSIIPASSPGPYPSLKRKRSPNPKPNPLHDPILFDSAEEDGIDGNSGSQRQEKMARYAKDVRTGPERDEYGLGLPSNESAGLGQHHCDNRQELRPQNRGKQHQAFQATLGQLQRDLELKEVEIRSLKSELDCNQKRLSEARLCEERLEHQVDQLTQRKQETCVQLQGLMRRCEGAESQLEKTKSLLQARSEELAASQAFLTTPDHFSIADLSRLVEELNNEIFQAALNLADAVLAPERLNSGMSSKAVGVGDASKAVASCYGDELTSRLTLGLAQRDPDPLLLESLIQNVFASGCSGLIQSICPGDAGLDKALRDIWEKLSVMYEPAVVKNWLAMTSSQFKAEGLKFDSAFKMLACLLAVRGEPMEPHSHHKLLEVALEKLSQLQQTALKVRKVAMEGIISADVEVFCVPMQSVYDPTSMQDIYESKDIPPDDTVICQTGLGLQYIGRTPTTPSSYTQPQRNPEVILKAKVLLASTLASQLP